MLHDKFCIGGNSPVEGYDGKYSCNCYFIEKVRKDQRMIDAKERIIQPVYVFMRIEQSLSWYEYNTCTYIYDEQIQYDESIISRMYTLANAKTIRNLLMAKESDRIEIW